MPTFIKRSRCVSEDLKAITLFVREEQMNWSILRPQLRNLRAMFHCYHQAIESPGRYKAWRRYDINSAKAFYALYDSKAKCLGYVDNFRRMATENLGGCPYCGLPSNITLDHYLPRKIEAFPEYSILSANLVPACSTCQGKKSDFYVAHEKKLRLTRGARFRAKPGISKAIKRSVRHVPKKSARVKRSGTPIYRIIHPYFDSFLLNPVLSVCPSEKPNTFNVQACGRLRKAERELLNFHLSKLKVSERSSGVIYRWRNAIIRDLSSIPIDFDRQSIMRELPRLLKSALERAALAPNTIEPAYIKSLMNNLSTLDDLIAWSKLRNEPNILAVKPIEL